MRVGVAFLGLSIEGLMMVVMVMVAFLSRKRREKGDREEGGRNWMTQPNLLVALTAAAETYQHDRRSNILHGECLSMMVVTASVQVKSDSIVGSEVGRCSVSRCD